MHVARERSDVYFFLKRRLRYAKYLDKYMYVYTCVTVYFVKYFDYELTCPYYHNETNVDMDTNIDNGTPLS